MHGKTVIKVEALTKRFPGVLALDKVNLVVEEGSVHCIMGENGAGKSTLVRALTGIYKSDEGRIFLDGRNVTEDRLAHNLIAYVPQEIDLFPNLTVAENLFMPFHKSGMKNPFISKQTLKERARHVLERFRIAVKPSELVRNISIANQQLLQIARAEAQAGYKILIMDEPTTSLTNVETEILFKTVRRLQSEGKAVIFISHKLDELFAIGDHVSVLRNGQLVGDAPVKTIDTKWIIAKMSGEEVDTEELFRPTKNLGEEVLTVKDLTGVQFSNISFGVKEGEILGFAGLVGSGRSELMQAVLGYRKYYSGSVELNHHPFKSTPANAKRSGMVYLPEERKQQGIFPSQSIQHNMGISFFNTTAHLSFISQQKERSISEAISDELEIKMRNLDQRIVFLSGGNQQKALIGRGIYGKPRIIIFDEPTKGIDVKAKAEIHRQMKHLAENERIAIVLISSELDEILKCTSRILTFYSGTITGEFITDNTERSQIVRGIIGAKE